MSETEETERVVVKTYVPRYQKERWVDHADDLDMNQSEFVRCMVQAGRANFDVAAEAPVDRPGTSGPADRGGGANDAIERSSDRESSDSDPEAAATGSVGDAGGPDRTSQNRGSEGVSDLGRRVLKILDEEGHCSWEQLVEHLTSDLEERLDDALQHLQQANRVQYSGRNGGYTVVNGRGQ